METANLLREAIVAVKAGQRQYARELFLELVEIQPTNDLAWMWLSGLLETREEKIQALENSILISEGGPNVEDRLHNVGLVDGGGHVKKFRAAVKALEAKRPDECRALLKELVGEHPNHEHAWMTLSELALNAEEQAEALDNVLRINPNNFKAREQLIRTQHVLYQTYLDRGRIFQQQSRWDDAIKAYKAAEKYASSGSFREAARQRWELLQGRSRRVVRPTSAPMSKPVLPGVLLSILLFLALHTLFNEFRPLDAPGLLFGGGAAVLIGGLMALGASRARNSPIWRTLLGQRALDDSTTRAVILMLGWLLLLAPFALLLIRVYQRRLL